jgi:Zn-finger nucleic acid-binding protein
MKCPNCSHELTTENYKGIEVNKCNNCGGMWFDSQEVDQLEDTVFNQDDLKNTMITNVKDSERTCPECGKKLKTFNYRWEDLLLDYCPTGDGYWLDKGEEERVTQIIAQREKDMERKYDAEKDWTGHLHALQSPTLINKIKDLLNLE